MNKFHTVVIDAPWNERGGGKIKRGADKHYPLMKEDDIIDTITKCKYWNSIDSNAHLYFWVTNNHLIEGIRVMNCIGFRYVTNIVWIKDHFGIGQYFRGQHELCLFGVRGKGQHEEIYTDARNIPSILQASVPRDDNGKRIHSRKPEEFFDIVERRSNGPYLELFARIKREGWTAWGNEIV